MMGGLDPTDEWTALLGGFLVAGGHGPAQPRDRRRGPERGAQGAERHGRRHQRHVPAGGHRGRNCCLGAIFLRRGAARSRARGGNPGGDRGTAASADRGRPSGNLDAAPRDRAAGARGTVSNAASEGFISGLNEIFALGGMLALLAAVAALWLVRERDIEREPNAEAPVPITDPDGRAVPSPRPPERAGWGWRTGRLTRQSIE